MTYSEFTHSYHPPDRPLPQAEKDFHDHPSPAAGDATLGFRSLGQTEKSFRSQRLQMVEQQIWARGITDERVLRAIAEVPRHHFVRPAERDLAYQDEPLPIGYDQTISQPYIVAFMTEAAHLTPGSKVLEIGTGSGYQAAILAKLAREVYTIEVVPALADRARQILNHLGYTNIHYRQGNGYAGWPEAAPFDAILVTAAPPELPQTLVDQLAPEGVLVIPVGKYDQQLYEMQNTSTGLVTQRVIPVRFVPMLPPR